MVADLIQVEIWNSQLINQNFQVRDADLIQQIPLTLQQKKDVWFLNRNIL